MYSSADLLTKEGLRREYLSRFYENCLAFVCSIYHQDFVNV